MTRQRVVALMPMECIKINDSWVEVHTIRSTWEGPDAAWVQLQGNEIDFRGRGFPVELKVPLHWAFETCSRSDVIINGGVTSAEASPER